jgi:hypothetical protein
MKRTRLAVAVLAAGACAVSSCGEIGARSAILAAEPESNVLGECEFDPGDAIIKAPVLAGGETCRCGLATSQTSMFHTSLAAKFERDDFLVDNIPERPGDSVVLRRVSATSLGGVKIEFRYGVVLCGRLGHFGAYWSHTDGLIGLDVLAQQIVEIDFDEGKIRFLRGVPEAAGERFEISSLQKRPRLCAVTVKARCCDEPAEDFYVELEEADTIQIRSRDYNKLLEDGRITQLHMEPTLGLSRVRPFGSFAGTAATFGIGGFRKSDVRVVAGGANVIGTGFLSRFVVTFDFPRGFIYLRPGKQFDRKDHHDISGLRLGWSNDSVVVHATQPRSPAESAGVLAGDRIVDVDGKPINRESRAILWRQLRQEGSTLRLRLKRDGGIVIVDLKLEALPEMPIDKGDEPAASHRPDHVPNYPARLEPSELPELIEPGEPENL